MLLRDLGQAHRAAQSAGGSPGPAVCGPGSHRYCQDHQLEVDRRVPGLDHPVKRERVPVGTVVFNGPVPGVVVKSMKRFAGDYVVWGTSDLDVAREWEQRGIVQASFYAIGE